MIELFSDCLTVDSDCASSQIPALMLSGPFELRDQSREAPRPYQNLQFGLLRSNLGSQSLAVLLIGV